MKQFSQSRSRTANRVRCKNPPARSGQSGHTFAGSPVTRRPSGFVWPPQPPQPHEGNGPPYSTRLLRSNRRSRVFFRIRDCRDRPGHAVRQALAWVISTVWPLSLLIPGSGVLTVRPSRVFFGELATRKTRCRGIHRLSSSNASTRLVTRLLCVL